MRGGSFAQEGVGDVPGRRRRVRVRRRRVHVRRARNGEGHLLQQPIMQGVDQAVDGQRLAPRPGGLDGRGDDHVEDCPAGLASRPAGGRARGPDPAAGRRSPLSTPARSSARTRSREAPKRSVSRDSNWTMARAVSVPGRPTDRAAPLGDRVDRRVHAAVLREERDGAGGPATADARARPPRAGVTAARPLVRKGVRLEADAEHLACMSVDICARGTGWARGGRREGLTKNEKSGLPTSALSLS